MSQKARRIELTPREIDLLLKYAYPFEEQAKQLRSSKPKNGWHVVHVEPYWISHWIGDLGYSARKIRGARLVEELDALCSTLDSAERLEAPICRFTLE